MRDGLFRKYLEREISEFSAQLPAHVGAGAEDDMGTYYLQRSLRSSAMARGLCTLTGVVHCKAAFTNSLQYLKFVYHFTTISKHSHMYSIIYLLLTRMNPGEQAVSYYPNWTGVESTTKWLNSMPHTIVAAKSQIQTVTRAYD